MLVLFLNSNDCFYFTIQKEKYDRILPFSLFFFFLLNQSNLSTVGNKNFVLVYFFETFSILQEECCFIAVGKVDI